MIEPRNVQHGAIVDALPHRGRHLVANAYFPRHADDNLMPQKRSQGVANMLGSARAAGVVGNLRGGVIHTGLCGFGYWGKSRNA